MAATDEHTPDDTLIPAAAVRARYGNISDMTLWRWERDENLGFPAADRIRGRRYWRLGKLRRWDEERARAASEAAD